MDGLYDEPKAREVAAGTIYSKPASLSVGVLVVVPTFSSEPIGPCDWMPRNGVLPVAGTPCVVVWDENRLPFVMPRV